MFDSQTLLLCFISILSIFFAIKMIQESSSVKAAFSLIMVFLLTAAQWFSLEATFLATLLVLVYVGAVMVLFLFVIMMIQGPESPPSSSKTSYLSLAVNYILVLGAMKIFTPSLGSLTQQLPHPIASSSVSAFAQALFTDYLIHFEVAGIILFVAMIAAVALTHRGPRNRRVQSIAEQQTASKEQRLTLIKDLKI